MLKIAKLTLTYCNVTTARLLKDFWPFFNNILAGINTRFFISNTFKIKQKLGNILGLNFCYLHFRHPCSHPKLIWHILENVQKTKCVSFNGIIWLIKMEMRVKMKNKSHRYNIHRTNPRLTCLRIYQLEYTKYKMCLSMMMAM